MPQDSVWDDPEHVEWLGLGARLGDYVRHISQRHDLRVRIFPHDDAQERQDEVEVSTAYFLPATASMTVNATKTLSTSDNPAHIDLMDYRDQARYPVLTGVTIHESAHAAFSHMNFPSNVDETSSFWALRLEESRCEARALSRRPQDADYLRGAMSVILSNSIRGEVVEGQEIYSAGRMAALVHARVDTGVFPENAVAQTRTRVIEILGEEKLEKLRQVWLRAQALSDEDATGLIACGHDFAVVLEESESDEEASSSVGDAQEQAEGGVSSDNSDDSSDKDDDENTGNDSSVNSEDSQTENTSSNDGNEEDENNQKSEDSKNGSANEESTDDSENNSESDSESGSESKSESESSDDPSSSSEGDSEDNDDSTSGSGSSSEDNENSTNGSESGSGNDSEKDDNSTNGSESGSKTSGQSNDTNNGSESNDSSTPSHENNSGQSSDSSSGFARQMPCGSWTPGDVRPQDPIETTPSSQNGQQNNNESSVPSEIEDFASEIQGDIAVRAGVTPPVVNNARARERAQEETARRESSQASREVFLQNPGMSIGTAASPHHVTQQTPTAENNALAKKLQKAISQAQFRDITRTRTPSLNPPGRMRANIAAHRDAQIAMGSKVTATPWEIVKRRTVPNPPLTAGIATDVSGSMDRWQQNVAVFTWALAKAIKNLEGTVASVSWNAVPKAVISPRQRLSTLPVPRCGGGSTGLPRAIEALDGALGLVGGNGVRMLVVLTDSELPDYTHIIKNINRLKKDDVIILWVTTCPIPPRISSKIKAEIITISNPSQFSTLVGQRITSALKNYESSLLQ